MMNSTCKANHDNWGWCIGTFGPELTLVGAMRRAVDRYLAARQAHDSETSDKEDAGSGDTRNGDGILAFPASAGDRDAGQEDDLFELQAAACSAELTGSLYAVLRDAGDHRQEVRLETVAQIHAELARWREETVFRIEEDAVTILAPRDSRVSIRLPNFERRLSAGESAVASLGNFRQATISVSVRQGKLSILIAGE
jgi:hypothetical protein